MNFTFMSVLRISVIKPAKWNSICRRYFNDKVRVRFAPSPTGFLHLGGLRTALYNHLFAKSRRGVTILRIEDTDLSRKVPLATENLINDLSWCGIKYDEGPYFQSERIEVYQKYLKQLLDQGDAYHCFCSAMRLELLRKESIKAGEVPKYDNICRHLTKQEVESKLESGHPYCIRFKLTTYNDSFQDLVFGTTNYNVAEVEGDPVILKNDGFPTYHFANVIDDHLMNISHVLRGVEWQISTTKHLLLYKAFKWEPPLYGHLPLLLNPDGTKISKRQGDAQIRDLKENGYLPNAVINFIIKNGGGFDIEAKERDARIFIFEELLERFDLSRIKLSSCKISPEDLNNYNRLEIKRLLKTESGSKYLIKATQELLENHFQNSGFSNFQISDQRIRKILELVKNRINKLDDLISENFNYIWLWENKWKEEDEEIIEVLKTLNNEFNITEWTSENLKKVLKEFSKKTSLQFPVLMKTLRVILCGSEEGPSVGELMELLGKEEVILRLAKALGQKITVMDK